MPLFTTNPGSFSEDGNKFQTHEFWQSLRDGGSSYRPIRRPSICTQTVRLVLPRQHLGVKQCLCVSECVGGCMRMSEYSFA